MLNDNQSAFAGHKLGRLWQGVHLPKLSPLEAKIDHVHIFLQKILSEFVSNVI